jgi:tRNA dimethylallyltransferase
MFDCFEGRSSLQEAVDLIKRNTRRFARKQMTWFRKFEGVLWFDASARSGAEEAALWILDAMAEER